nr:hypothetical protein [Escherichia coli]
MIFIIKMIISDIIKSKLHKSVCDFTIRNIYQMGVQDGSGNDVSSAMVLIVAGVHPGIQSLVSRLRYLCSPCASRSRADLLA